MLLFLVFYACLQPLWGKPLPPPVIPRSEVTANITGTTVMTSECPTSPDTTTQQLRSVYDIVQTCLFTIFACVWTSIHPNINGPKDSWWACTKRRLVTTFYAVIAPEAILLWALRQRFSAKQIAERYNREFQTLEETEMSVWAKFRQWFQPLPKSTTRRGVKEPWTITHGFFVQMGGFILYDGEYPKHVLDYDQLEGLLQKKAIEAPTVTERDLQDKSRGDTISKAIVVLQASWFVLQCVVRASQHLPLSELEVLTLAFAVMNAAIYAAWWSKPQGVDMAIGVPLKQGDNGADSPCPSPGHPRQTDNQNFDSIRLLTTSPEPESHEDTDDSHSWLELALQQDRENHNLIAFLFARLPYRIVSWVARPFWKLNAKHQCQEGGLRMSMFYVGYTRSKSPMRVTGFIGIIFGAIHLLGWTSEHPLLRDRILWQISAAILTVTPFILLVVYVRDDYEHKIVDVVQAVVASLLYFVLFPLYIVARFVVIAIAFKGILHPPHNVLVDISWTRYIPHF